MRQRARLLGGALRVGARLDGWRGASVELTVPPAQGVIT
jgi:nitrate/nitrite-specific signal transduction histidine kinase